MKNWPKAFLQAVGVIAANAGVALVVFFSGLYRLSLWFFLLTYIPNIVAFRMIRQTDERIRLVASGIAIWIPFIIIGLLIDGFVPVIMATLALWYQLLPLALLLAGLLIYRKWFQKNRQADL